RRRARRGMSLTRAARPPWPPAARPPAPLRRGRRSPARAGAPRAARASQARSLAIVPRHADLGDAVPERPRDGERLGVEDPAVQARRAIGGLGRLGAPELEAAEEV